ncbi:phosphoenolpyruvate--protein phosphotransferase [Firmicutes bacterium AM43-11BH]|mgnify:FL=1|nr:phosphoenolpyruvate--protein phosphotransferase [Firmicutes bacterium AM41-5BH]RHS79952.1 phosphoenolpyruvate--protein phosphotransferase [Firmicutes bacterium AM43-11BH]RHV00297.1 phosphoenolpyruvate--protein phosphotransferase [Firmicutes bacterium OM07-11]
MEIIQGKAIFGGIAIGPISFFAKEQKQVKRTKVEDTEAEIARYEAALATAIEQLGALYEKALKEVGESEAQIFEVHQMMLEDDDYNDSVKNIITSQGLNAEYAVATTGDNFSTMFAAMDDEYFQARAVDVKDISERIINILMGIGEAKVSDEPSIIVAEDLAPSETVQMDKSKLLGFVTRLGSSNSHTAILARTMNIPALIQVDIKEEWNGKQAIIDGFSGKFIIEPEADVLEEYQKKQAEQLERRRLLAEQKGKPTVTKNGKAIKLFANIGSVSDLQSVMENDAAGIGLFRSEFLYLESDTYPTEEEQFKAYKMVAETMAGKKVIIRTLDIGADKQVDYFELDKEENPAMGLRAIRICLTRPEIFKTQLRALLRASAFGNIAVMYPMIISVEEVRKIKAIMEEVKAELDEAGIPYGNVEQGIMIETPAAVILSDLLAKEVDFFSIGTNDLTQYTLAIDRQNAKLDEFYNPHHEAVLRMIQMVVENAHKAGIWAGICGELGADLELTDRFMEMGVDELSVSPTFIYPVRQKIREYDGETK